MNADNALCFLTANFIVIFSRNKPLSYFLSIKNELVTILIILWCFNSKHPESPKSDDPLNSKTMQTFHLIKFLPSLVARMKFAVWIETNLIQPVNNQMWWTNVFSSTRHFNTQANSRLLTESDHSISKTIYYYFLLAFNQTTLVQLLNLKMVFFHPLSFYLEKMIQK